MSKVSVKMIGNSDRKSFLRVDGENDKEEWLVHCSTEFKNIVFEYFFKIISR